MKRSISLLTVLLFCCLSLPAQNVIQHKKGDDLKQYLLDSIKFISEDYQSGFVKFRDGSSARGPVNISTIEQRIYFINPSGDVQVLVNEDQVSYVTFSGRTFIKSKYGYLELLATVDEAAMGVVRRVTFLEADKKGAYGSSSQTTSVSTVTSFQEAGVMYTLGADKETPFLYKVLPYFYKNDKVLLSNRKNLIKCFPEKKAFIETYLNEHSVDFEKAEDVSALFEALKQAPL